MANLREAARIIGVKPRSLYARIERGTLPQATKQKGRWVIPNAVLEPYVGTMRISAAAELLHQYNRQLSKQTLYSYVSKGFLPAVRDHLGIIYVKRSDLEELFQIPKKGQ